MQVRRAMEIFRLAGHDFRHEWRMSLCSVLGVAVVLAPLLVLFGLKFGIVSGMLERLANDPRNLELRPIGQGRYSDDFFERLGDHPGVGFLLPNTRYLAAPLTLRNDAQRGSAPVDVSMVPTAPGDPLLGDRVRTMVDDQAIVVSASVAQRLGVVAGDVVTGLIGRQVAGERQQVALGLVIGDILPAAQQGRDVAFVGLPLLLATEAYREGFAVPAFGWSGETRGEAIHTYASFRLYAASVNDVLPLRAYLLQENIDADTKAGEIAWIEELDRGLTTLFAIISVLGVTGYFMSMAVSLWASVVRKQRDLSVLQLIGYTSRLIAFFPVVQALLAAACGTALAIAIYLVVEPGVNALFAERLADRSVQARLLPVHFALAIAASLVCAGVAACAAGLRAARIQPAKGLRDE